MENLKEQRIKTLEEDINKTFNKIVEIRKNEAVKFNGFKNAEFLQPNYKDYFSLSVALVNLYTTYERQLNYPNAKMGESIFINNFTILINNEINEIHKLMNIYQEINYIPQYKTLSKLYSTFIDLSNRLPEKEQKNNNKNNVSINEIDELEGNILNLIETIYTVNNITNKKNEDTLRLNLIKYVNMFADSPTLDNPRLPISYYFSSQQIYINTISKLIKHLFDKIIKNKFIDLQTKNINQTDNESLLIDKNNPYKYFNSISMVDNHVFSSKPTVSLRENKNEIRLNVFNNSFNILSLIEDFNMGRISFNRFIINIEDIIEEYVNSTVLKIIKENEISYFGFIKPIVLAYDDESFHIKTNEKNEVIMNVKMNIYVLSETPFYN